MRSLLLSLSLVASAALGVCGAELGIETTHAVECSRKTQKGDSIQVHYRGTLQNGNEFDASYNRGSPFKFRLGAGQVIKGWDQGLMDMCIGEKRTLTVPPELGYGGRAVGTIPADSTLIFETELIGIDNYKPDITSESPASSSTTDNAASTASEAAGSATQKIADKIASKVAEAADAAKTLVADTDDTQEHNEL